MDENKFNESLKQLENVELGMSNMFVLHFPEFTGIKSEMVESVDKGFFKFDGDDDENTLTVIVRMMGFTDPQILKICREFNAANVEEMTLDYIGKDLSFIGTETYVRPVISCVKFDPFQYTVNEPRRAALTMRFSDIN